MQCVHLTVFCISKCRFEHHWSSTEKFSSFWSLFRALSTTTNGGHGALAAQGAHRDSV